MRKRDYKKPVSVTLSPDAMRFVRELAGKGKDRKTRSAIVEMAILHLYAAFQKEKS